MEAVGPALFGDFLETLEQWRGNNCETIDPVTGWVKTGAAFATGAGFLAHSLSTAIREELTSTVNRKIQRRNKRKTR